MKRTAIALLMATAACAQPVQEVPVQPAPPQVPVGVETIRPQDFFARIGFLASDALGGRDTPSQGLEAAAEYIASEFRTFGVAPAGENGTYFQRWPFTTRALDVAGTRLEVRAGGNAIPLAYGSDFYAQAGGSGSFEGGMVFLGAEPSAIGPQALRGRVVVMMQPVPADQQQAREVQQAFSRTRAAVDSAGARAMILVLPAQADADAIARSAAQAERPSRGRAASMPTFFLRNDRARALFQAANLDFNAVTARPAGQPPVPMTGLTAQLGAPVAETTHMPPNVAGMIQGSDPQLRNTYVVFSAHIDHVGSGCRGTSAADNICNGADDDASGTSAIMELAEAFASLPTPPKRSLIFLGVSGEEKGLLGSSYYADNPTVPIESIVANINIDMIGRNNPDSVVVIGKDYSTLGPTLERVNAAHPELRMTTSDDIWPEQRFFFRSDHFNFARREVPAIFFFTGTHEDYHAASDHVEKIDLDKITRITRLIFHYGMDIANDAQKPQWDPEGLEEVRRLVSGGR